MVIVANRLPDGGAPEHKRPNSGPGLRHGQCILAARAAEWSQRPFGDRLDACSVPKRPLGATNTQPERSASRL
jgi:hypothetical protein